MSVKILIIEFLKTFGISSEIFIAGASGSIVFLTSSKKMTNIQRFFTILSGGLSANYLTPITASWFNLDNSFLYGTAFLLGYSGMKGVEKIMHLIDNEISSRYKNKKDE